MKEFLNKIKNLSWVDWTITYCRENTLMASIIGGVAVFVLLVLCIMIGKACSKKKKTAQIAVSEAPVEETANEETQTSDISPASKSVKSGVASVYEPVFEPATVRLKEDDSTPKKKTASVKPKIETKVAPKTKTVGKKPTKKEYEEPFSIVDAVHGAPDEVHTHEEDETEKQAKYKGKWQICRVITDDENGEEMFFFELRASNGEKLLSSEEYTSYQGALRGIQTHKSNILSGNLKITLTKKGDYIFRLLSGKNTLLCMGENYPTKARCESAMESTVRFAETAIIDENIQDIVVKVAKEEDTPLPPLPDGYNGKWIISSRLSKEGDKIYFFELFANNGEKLLSGEEYMTYVGAVNGIRTHKKNIERDNFRISLTKRGDYIYKLLSANGQLLCLGEHYKTKRLCQNAVESVKRFALSAPVLTDEKNA